MSDPHLLNAGVAPVEFSYQRSLNAFVGFSVLWFVVLAFFHSFPQIDIGLARSFFLPFTCDPSLPVGKVCGYFPYTQQAIFAAMRQILFPIPAAVGLVLIVILVRALQHHGATYDREKVRRLCVSILSLVIGPYLLVNLVIKLHSGRPRPYETDMFGGPYPFVPAGSFAGKCVSNCSFISGESAGAGWLMCLVLLLPRRLWSIVIPPMLAVSLVTAALRVAFGGHYLSDAILGWLSAPVVFFALMTISQISHRRK